MVRLLPGPCNDGRLKPWQKLFLQLYQEAVAPFESQAFSTGFQMVEFRLNRSQPAASVSNLLVI
jgi:hypothetical protein